MSAAATAMSTNVGSVDLPNPIMTASGTSGHGIELAEYGDLSALGAVVVKSLSIRPWACRARGWRHGSSTTYLRSRLRGRGWW